MKRIGRKANLLLENRIRLNAGKVPAYELAWLMGMGYTALKCKAARMGVSLRVENKEKMA